MTHTIKVVGTWERFKRLTVWHPIHTDPADDYRHGPRFWYPVFDLIMFAIGLYGFYLGSPLLNSLFPSWFVDTLGLSIATAALLAAFGVVFPKLFLLELTGKMLMVFLLGGYAGTVAWLSPNAGENGFVVGILMALVWLLGPRLSWLFIRVGRWLEPWWGPHREKLLATRERKRLARTTKGRV